MPLPPALLDCYSEYLPTPGYVGTAGSTTPAMHFRVTARDAYLNGGGTSSDDVVLTLDPTKGPFAVTSQSAPGTAAQGGLPLAVAWSVNGTADAGAAGPDHDVHRRGEELRPGAGGQHSQ